jgi:hypothetical protein
MEEKTTIPLVEFIVHMYRIEDIIVIFMKLYSTTINKGTMPCIETLFFIGVNRIAPPMKLYHFLTFALFLVELKV